MKQDKNKTKAQLIAELDALRQRVSEMEIALARSRTHEEEITRMEDALRASEELYRRLIEASPDAITVTDLTGQVLMCNQQTATLQGYDSAEQLVGTSAFAPFAPEDLPRAQERLQKTFETGVIRNAEYTLFKRDGTRYPIELSAAVMRDAQGRPTAFVGITRDITERKRTALELEQYRQQLEELVRARTVELEAANERLELEIAERKQAESALARRAQEMSALYETSLEVNSQPDLATLLPALVRRATEMLGAAGGGLYLMRSDQILELVVSYQLLDDYTGATLGPGEGLSGRVAQTGEPLMVTDYQNWQDRANIYRNIKTRRVLGVPLKHQGRIIGVINVADTERSDPFTEDDVRLARLFADQAAIAVENARLYEAAQRELLERQRTEEALRASEAKYRRLFEEAAIGIFHSTVEGRFIDVNPALARMMGYASPQEVVSVIYSIADQVYAEPPRRAENAARALAEGKAVMIENRYRRKDGSIWVGNLLLRFVASESDQKGYFEGFVEDITERKRAEEIFQKQREEQKVIFDSLPAIIWYLDSESRVQWGNRFAAAALGLSESDLLGKTVFDLFPAQEAAKFHADNLEVIRTGKSKSGIIEQYRTAGGEIRWAQTDKLLYRDETGSIAGVIVFAIDITERKQAEEARQESEARLRTLSDNLPGGLVYQIDSGEDGQQRRFAYISAGVEQLHGITVAQAVNDAMTIYGQVVEEDQLLVTQREALALANMKPFSAEVRLRLPSGETRWRLFTSAPRRLPNHHLVWDGIEIDITERKQAEKLLVDSEKAYRGLLNALNQAIYIQDRQGRFLDVNDGAVRMYGYPREFFVGKTPELVSAPGKNDLAAVASAVARAFAGEPQRLEFWGRRSNGEVFPKEVRLDKGEFLGQEVVIAAADDITERKRAEEELERLYKQTQRDAQIKSELLREVNHRVKNNLIGIIGLLLAEQRYTPPEGRSFVESAVDSLIARINGLLEVHTMLSEAEWAPMYLSEVAARVINTIISILSSDQWIKVEVAPSSIKVSPRQANNLALVFNELATNTIKYALAKRETAHITVQAVMEGDLIHIEYRDDGPGYPEEVVRLERHGAGIYLLKSLVAHSLRGTVTLANDGGAVTRMRIKTEERDRT